MKINKNLFLLRCFGVLFVLSGLVSVAMTFKTLSAFNLLSEASTIIIKLFFFVTLGALILNSFVKKEIYSLKPILILLLYNVCQIIYGVTVSETYWDFKGLVNNSFWLLLPFMAYIGTDEFLVKRLLSYYVFYGLIILFAIASFLPSVGYGYYLVPFTFFLLFLPAVNFKMKVIAIIILLVVVLTNTFSRSNMISYIAPFLLGVSYLFHRFIPLKTFNIARYLFFGLPFVLLFLALSGTFNVFKLSDYIEGDYVAEKSFSNTDVGQKNLLGDTRTFLYVEVISSAKVFDSWYIGRSPARGNLSAYFGHEDMNGRSERLSNEVNMLNIFTWTGVIGLILYSSVFFLASGLAINHSNNIYCKVLGVFLSFKWAYGWVEEFSRFDVNFLMIWLFIGMCFSEKFRCMSNVEFKIWVGQIAKLKFK